MQGILLIGIVSDSAAHIRWISGKNRLRIKGGDHFPILLTSSPNNPTNDLSFVLLELYASVADVWAS